MRSIAGMCIAWSLIGCTEGTRVTQVASPELAVYLGASVEKIEGGAWPKEGSKWNEDFVLQVPTDVRVVLPLGEEFQSQSQLTFLSQQNGVLTGVELQPAERLLPYQDAIDVVEQFFGKMKALDQKNVGERIKVWRSSEPAINRSRTLSSGGFIPGGVKLYAAIRVHSSGDGRYVILGLYDARSYGIEKATKHKNEEP